MRTRELRWLTAAFCGLLAACAIITVNVYFPEKDVREAYKSLDEMLLKQGTDGNAPAEGTPPAENPDKKSEDKPQSSLFGGRISFSLVPAAFAQDKVADELAVEMSSMPEVLKAYDAIKATIPQLRELRDSGAVGENKQGLLTIRDKTKIGDKEPVVKAVNENRKVVITGMAKAILRVNKQPETAAAMNQVLGKAAATFAEIRREKAKPGWWVELPNGRWVQK
jgi:uncharacterized protein YdbL (DUF1318 family)